MALFETEATIQSRYGTYLFPSKRVVWRFSAKTAADHFVLRVNEAALPVLTRINTIDDFYRFAMTKDEFQHGDLEWRHLSRIVVEAARGDFDAVDITSAILLKTPNNWSTWEG